MYNLIIRPLLFCIDPEKVHRMLLSWLKFYRYLFPVRACVRGYSRVSDPFSYGHLQFKNRIGLSAGFDKNAEAFDELADFGFGFLEVGTVTPDSQSGNPSPRIFRLVDDESLISRTGFNNCGVDAVRQHIRKYRKHSYVLGVNINKNPLSTGDQIVKDFESTFIHLYDCVDYFTLNWGSIGGHHNRDREYEFVTTFEAVLKPIKHFEIRANYSWAHYNQQNLNRSVDVLYSRNPGETITMDNGRTRGNYLSEIQNNQIRQTFNLYGTYDNTFANAHSVKVIVGGNYDYKYFKKLGMKRNGLLSESLDDFNLAKGDDISITGGQEEYAILGFFYRLNYGYKDRYLFEASGRYDGSSRFRRGHRFGFFPSFSAGWRVSEEAFFTQAKNYVSNLKLRLSYGSLGNQKTVGYYDYLQLINTGAVMNYAFGDTTKGDYAYESAPNSTDLTWETVITKNIGLDLGFLNNRLNVSFDAYIRDTKDMLMAGKTLPGVYGASSPRMNVADLRTKGWEASVTWGDSFTLASKPFNYRIMAGIGDNTSKVTKYDNPNRTLTDPYEGQQLGEIWGYVVDGYFKTDEEARNYKVDQSFVNQMINASALDNGLHAGDLKFVDLDGNNKIEQTTSANDRKDMKVIGNSLPRYNYNFGISADWYGIDFSVLFQGIGKQNWYPGAETSMFWGPYSRPYASFIPSDFMSQVWSEENTNAYFPRPRGYVALGSNRELAVVNTKYLQNLAYCRLKNLSIGYTLPDKWLSKIGFEKIRVYFSGENLLTFTKLHSDYIDPEQASASNSWKTSKSDANIYPWAKTYSFGVDITF